MTLHILIPCKSLSAGKSRLSAVLDTRARRALCALFLERTLDVALSLVPAACCHVVTGDADAAGQAAKRGASVIVDPGRGLNDALRVGRDAICAQAAEPIALLILPIDLPFAVAAVLDEVCKSAADVVIAPDRGRTGTNALFLAPRAKKVFAFHFGPDSFAAHQDVARRNHWRVEIFENARLAFDVDRPADYWEWQQDAAKDERPSAAGVPSKR